MKVDLEDFCEARKSSNENVFSLNFMNKSHSLSTFGEKKKIVSFIKVNTRLFGMVIKWKISITHLNQGYIVFF